MIIIEQQIGKQVKGNDYGLIWGTIQAFSYRDQGNPQEINEINLSPGLYLTRNLLNMMNDIHSIATISDFVTPNWMKVHL
jgi:hypothetical protein